MKHLTGLDWLVIGGALLAVYLLVALILPRVAIPAHALTDQE